MTIAIEIIAVLCLIGAAVWSPPVGLALVGLGLLAWGFWRETAEAGDA